MRRPRKSINQINVVPYIDVMLVLLVIFMVTAPLVTPGAIELPSVGTKPAVPVAPLQVRVQRNGSYSLRDQQSPGREQVLTRAQLVERVRAKQGSGAPQAVVIEADKGVQYEKVVEVLDALQQGGAKQVGLLVKPAS